VKDKALQRLWPVCLVFQLFVELEEVSVQILLKSDDVIPSGLALSCLLPSKNEVVQGANLRIEIFVGLHNQGLGMV